MAIVIYNQPSSLEPVYSPFYFKVGGFGTSSNPNFRYVFDTYVKDVTGSTFSFANRTKLFPGTGGYGIYSPARIVENYVSFNIQNLFNTGFSTSIQSVVHYQVQFSEEWTTSGSTYTFTGTTNNGGFVQYNYPFAPQYILGDRIKINKANKAYNSEYDGIQTITSVVSSKEFVTDKVFGDVVANESGTTTYRLTLNSGVTFSGTAINFARQFTQRTLDIPATFNIGINIGQPLTNHTLAQPTYSALNGKTINSSINVTGDEHYQLSFVSNNPSFYPEYMLIYTYYKSTGFIRAVFRITNTLPTTNVRFDFGIGPANLANVVASDLLMSGSYNIFDANVGTMVFVPVTFSGGTYYQGGEVVAVQINEDCSRYEQYRLAFLNRLGGFDIFRFSRKSTRKINIEREMFTKSLSWDYATTDRGETTLNVNYNEEITANSNWLTEKEAQIMEELFCSTEVYSVDDANQQIQPVVVLSKDYITKTVANNKLIQYTIVFRFSYKNNLQRN